MIHKGILKSYDSGTHKASVQIIGSLSLWLDNIPVSQSLAAAEMVAGRSVAVLSLDPGNPADCFVVGLWGTTPSSSSSIPSGATVPAAPANYSLFVHTPTGRTVLLLYDGTNWVPLNTFGTLTVYVDNTDGTDGINYGGAIDAGAFKTTQYALDQIPDTLGGNVDIYLNGEAYAEDVVIRGKQYGGDYSISIHGTLSTTVAETTATGGDKGALTTRPFVTKAGAGWGVNAYRAKLCHFTSGSNNGLYRVIHNNTNEILHLCGRILPADPINNDTFEILDWDTSIQRLDVVSGQKAIKLYDLEFTRADGIGLNIGSLDAAGFAECYAYRIKKVTHHSVLAVSASWLYIENSYLYHSSTGYRGLYVEGLSFIWAEGVLIRGKGRACYLGGNSLAFVRQGCTFEGIDDANRMYRGIWSDSGSTALCYDMGRKSNVEWCTIALDSDRTGKILFTSSLILANNTTDKEPLGAADPSYID